MANNDSAKHASDQNHESYADDAKARRVLNVLDDGTPVDAANPLPISLASDIEIGAVEIKDGESDTRGKVTTEHIEFFKDERDNALCTSAACYGQTITEAVGQRMRPMVMDIDDGNITQEQQPQLVIPLNYYYEAKSQSWQRWQGEDGFLWVYVTNMPETDYRDDYPFTVGSDRGVAIGGVATTDSVDENDYGVLRITTDRSLVVTNEDITDGTQKTQLVDSDGSNLSLSTESAISALQIQDNNSEILLSAVLKELKKLNMQMMILTDTVVSNAEVD